MVGAEGFEPPTLCSQSRCATRLRYAPTLLVYRIEWASAASKRAEQNVSVYAEQRVHQASEDPGEQEHG
jgi:hypothetical protein